MCLRRLVLDLDSINQSCNVYFLYLPQVSDSSIESALSILRTVDPSTLHSDFHESIVPSQEEMNLGEKTLISINETNLR